MDQFRFHTQATAAMLHAINRDNATEFRIRTAPASQTIFNSDPADIAATVIGHDRISSLPGVGLHLPMAFGLADPETVHANGTCRRSSNSGDAASS